MFFFIIIMDQVGFTNNNFNLFFQYDSSVWILITPYSNSAYVKITADASPYDGSSSLTTGTIQYFMEYLQHFFYLTIKYMICVSQKYLYNRVRVETLILLLQISTFIFRRKIMIKQFVFQKSKLILGKIEVLINSR